VDFDENSGGPLGGALARLRVPEGSATQPWPARPASLIQETATPPTRKSGEAHRGRNPDQFFAVAVWNSEMRDGCHASFNDVRRSWEVDVTRQNREFLELLSRRAGHSVPVLVLDPY
jgi:hypothetical protein